MRGQQAAAKLLLTAMLLTSCLLQGATEQSDDELSRQLSSFRECCGDTGVPMIGPEPDESWHLLRRMIFASALLDVPALQLRAAKALALAAAAWPPLERPPRCCTHGRGSRMHSTGQLEWSPLRREKHRASRDPEGKWAYQALRTGCVYMEWRAVGQAAERELLCPPGVYAYCDPLGVDTELVLDGGEAARVFNVLQHYWQPSARPATWLRLPARCRISAAVARKMATVT